MALSANGSAPAKPSKLRWGELEEDDGEDLDFLLPPRQVIGPDENGIKRVIEYKFDDDGHKVKITTTTRVRKLAKARLSKRAVERRNWAKFGDAVHEDVGSRLTMVSTEEILLERPRAPGQCLFSTNFPIEKLGLDVNISLKTLTFDREIRLEIRQYKPVKARAFGGFCLYKIYLYLYGDEIALPFNRFSGFYVY